MIGDAVVGRGELLSLGVDATHDVDDRDDGIGESVMVDVNQQLLHAAAAAR